MSKSLGNIIPLIDAVKEDGADSVRLSILSTAELLGDADFSKPLARSVRLRLEKLYNLSKRITTMRSGEESSPPSRLDRWLLSRLQARIKATTNAMDDIEVRDAIQEAFYGLDRDVHWYLRRINNKDTGSTWSLGTAETLRTVLDVWVRLLSPFIPHLCEEIWSMLGNKGYVSITEWPSIDGSKVDRDSELCESLIESTLEDTQSILKAIKISPGRIYYYTAADWKWTVYLQILDTILAGETDVGNIVRKLMSDPELRVRGEEAVPYIRKVFHEVRRLDPDLMKVRAVSERIDEIAALHSAADLFENEFSAKVEVFNEEDSQKYDPRSRSNSSVPYRPAIYVE